MMPSIQMNGMAAMKPMISKTIPRRIMVSSFLVKRFGWER
jgi:hypothetical protein